MNRTTSPVLHFVDSWVKKFETADIKAVFFVTHPQQVRFVGKVNLTYADNLYVTSLTYIDVVSSKVPSSYQNVRL